VLLEVTDGLSRAGRIPAVTLAFAHRGAPRPWVRENSLAAFSTALDAGLTALESDVWLTGDGIPVLVHDGEIQAGLRRLRVAAANRAALPRYIPTLAGLYAAAGTDFDLSLDVKDSRAAAATVAVAAEAGAADRLWLCGGGAPLVSWRELDDRVRLVNSSRRKDIPEGVPARVKSLAAAGIAALNMKRPDWDEASVKAVHDAGLLAFSWDIQRRSSLARARAWGIDGFFSDSLALLASVKPAGPGRTQQGPIG
jgi:glycerophosphoryl diester phosphodiesterase